MADKELQLVIFEEEVLDEITFEEFTIITNILNETETTTNIFN